VESLTGWEWHQADQAVHRGRVSCILFLFLLSERITEQVRSSQVKSGQVGSSQLKSSQIKSNKPVKVKSVDASITLRVLEMHVPRMYLRVYLITMVEFCLLQTRSKNLDNCNQ
jgi:hypothetical protein